MKVKWALGMNDAFQVGYFSYQTKHKTVNSSLANSMFLLRVEGFGSQLRLLDGQD